MRGFKKSNTEDFEEKQETSEVSSRQRVRRRVNTRTEVAAEETPMEFSFGRAQIDDDDDSVTAEEVSTDDYTEEVTETAEEVVGEINSEEETVESVEEDVKEVEEPIEKVVKEPVEEVAEKRRSDAQKSLDRILSGGEKTRRDSLLRKVQNTIAVYNSRNSGVTSEDIQVRYYHDDMNEVLTTEDGRLIFPNQRIYYRGFTEEWDRVNEVRVPNGAEFEVDLGIGIFLPDGYELELAGVRELRTKYELELIDGVIHLSRQNAMFPIVVQMRAIGDMAYVQKHKSLIQARLVRV